MSEERYTFEQARARLEDIVKQVRDKDTSLEASLDLLEESVRLANQCTELIDHTQWRTALAEEAAVEGEADTDADAGDADAADVEPASGEPAESDGPTPEEDDEVPSEEAV